ncbi:MAG: hypothetical protein L0387_02040 [Acidobacteria bacterium]|nr:hypothetical protein [Acidobacteriota bacterium]MCI0717878.1 hypothetical protein [Acidobacteriota bacterium]
MMQWICRFALFAVLPLGAVPVANASLHTVPAERIQLIKEIQKRLNISFQCEFSISIGQTRKYAMANSSGIIIVDKAFLETADRGRIFFAIAHEYAHAYLEHDVRLYEHLSKPIDYSAPKNLPEIRRRFEKEADGIAARKAKEMGFPIESILDFILTQPDAEKGFHPDLRAYCKPRERAAYILAVYQSS